MAEYEVTCVGMGNPICFARFGMVSIRPHVPREPHELVATVRMSWPSCYIVSASTSARCFACSGVTGADQTCSNATAVLLHCDRKLCIRICFLSTEAIAGNRGQFRRRRPWRWHCRHYPRDSTNRQRALLVLGSTRNFGVKRTR